MSTTRFELSVLLVVLAAAAAIPPVALTAQSQIPAASLPAFITSSGQSPDAFTIKVLCDRAKIKADYEDLAEPDKLTGMKTLILAIGGSAKGLGAAGIDEDEELARVSRLLDKAKELKIFAVGIHIDGEARRGPLSEKFIEATAPRCNYLIVKEDGNSDGYFTKLGTAQKIPVTIIKETLQVAEVLE